MWAIICGEKNNFLNSCSIASLCQNSRNYQKVNYRTAKQYFKNSINFSFHHKLQPTSIDTYSKNMQLKQNKHTGHSMDSLHHTSYVQNKHSRMQCLNAVLIYYTMILTHTHTHIYIYIHINIQYTPSQTSELHLPQTQQYTAMRNEPMKKPQHS